MYIFTSQICGVIVFRFHKITVKFPNENCLFTYVFFYSYITTAFAKLLKFYYNQILPTHMYIYINIVHKLVCSDFAINTYIDANYTRIPSHLLQEIYNNELFHFILPSQT